MADVFPAIERLKAKGVNLAPVTRSSDRMKPGEIVLGAKSKTNEAPYV